jgi:protein Tex
MRDKLIKKIAEELELDPARVLATAGLLDEGSTVPFIARYRKEVTGSLDEVAIIRIRDRLEQLEELEKRRESILKSLKERELLTEDLEKSLLAAGTLTTLEDLYLPFRPKRRTRATIAREKGLEPLAAVIFEQDDDTDPFEEAALFVDEEKGVESVDAALRGARDILAEWISEDADARERMRELFKAKGRFRSRVVGGKEEAAAKYRDYFDLEAPVTSAPSHRILAMRRGEKEGFLTLGVTPPKEEALRILEGLFVKGDGKASRQVMEALEEGYDRLLSSSMETEIRLETKKRADAEAIQVFADNLKELLLTPPLGEKTVMGIDPGLRTGCKLACLDRQGKVTHTDTIYLVGSEQQKSRGAETIRDLCKRFGIETVAVGNGTGGRETERFIRGLNLGDPIQVLLVSESGASVYSASEVARKEFPDLDLTLRGAASIGRRLMDPLAELVKIEPKAIGVGQYQHDVNQTALKRTLDDVVVSCVNAVGVEVNTASEELLTYVSGLGPQMARNLVAWRDTNGPFSSREDFSQVPRLGPKAFEQSAGFLRIRNGRNPLDASAVHPESYGVVEAMAGDQSCSVQELMANGAIRDQIDLSRYVTNQVGMPTLTDIMAELAKPGRDPRKTLDVPGFAEGIEDVKDLEPGMTLDGVVTNVTAFGAFVDVGVHQDGLVHISQLADRFVKDPHRVVKVNQWVKVKVLEVDLARGRVSLSMKKTPPGQKPVRGTKKTADKIPVQKRKPEKPKVQPFNNPFDKVFKGK